MSSSFGGKARGNGRAGVLEFAKNAESLGKFSFCQKLFLCAHYLAGKAQGMDGTESWNLRKKSGSLGISSILDDVVIISSS